ncbi:Lsr2 family protein [Streptomyces olivoreticuli]
MAQKIVTIYTDDLTGEESQEAATHTFSLDGVAYEIDLGPDSYEQILTALSPFIGKGRKVGRLKSQGGAKRQGGSRTSSQDAAKIRAWAKEQGYNVNDRGRVSAEIREAYDKAN